MIAPLVSVLLFSLHFARVYASPNFVVSKIAYDETTRSLNAHVKHVSSLPGFRNGSTPLFYLHRPGSKVYGTVIIFHGYGQNAAASAIQTKFLYSKKFNVVAFNLAGFAQTPKYWISGRLRKSAGYDVIRKALLTDSTISPIIAQFVRQGTVEKQRSFHKSLKEFVVPKIFASLKKKLSRKDFEVAERALTLLKPGLIRNGMEKDARNYFISGHQTFESDPFEKLQLVQALPGPVYAMGFSFGGATVLNLAARSKVISKAVFLASFFGRFTNKKQADFINFGAILSALDLITTTSLDGVQLPSGSIVASILASNLLNRDVIINSMRESTKTLCIIAEDDVDVDMTHTLEVCRSKLGGKAFVYPRRLNLGHSITPETGNRYGNSMLEQIANYFSSGNIEESKFLIPN